MKRIETNYEKLYIKGEKSGSATVTLTCDNPITVNIISYTNDLTGSVSINTTGNNTNTVNINVEYADLYLNGETYSGVINASTSTDQLSIPVIINCSDTLIYTNIPNNVIDKEYYNTNNRGGSSIPIIYNSLPHVNRIKHINKSGGVLDDYELSEEVDRIYLSKSELEVTDYVIASNTLSQVSVFIDCRPNYIFKPVTASPITASYDYQAIEIFLYSLKDGEPIQPSIRKLDLVNYQKCTLIDEKTGLYKVDLYISENNSEEIVNSKLVLYQPESLKELQWDIIQKVNPNPHIYYFYPITEQPINIDYYKQEVILQFICTKDGKEYNDFELSLKKSDGIVRSIESDGKGLFTATLLIKESIYSSVHTISVMFKTNKLLNPITHYWDIHQLGYPEYNVVARLTYKKNPDRDYILLVNKTFNYIWSGTQVSRTDMCEINKLYDENGEIILPDVVSNRSVAIVVGWGNSNKFDTYTCTTDSEYITVDMYLDVSSYDIDKPSWDDEFISWGLENYYTPGSDFLPDYPDGYDPLSIGHASCPLATLFSGTDLVSGTFSEVNLTSHIYDRRNTAFIFNSCEYLQSIPNIFDSNIVNSNLSVNSNLVAGSAAFAFANAKSLTDISYLSGWDMSGVTNLAFAFKGCESLIDASPLASWDTSNVYSMQEMFTYCKNLTTVPLLDASSLCETAYNVTWYGCYDMFKGCSSLTNLGGLKNLKYDLDLSGSPLLTHESLMNVINNLADNVTGSIKTLTLGKTNLNKLTDEEKAIAINKGWSLS